MAADRLGVSRDSNLDDLQYVYENHSSFSPVSTFVTTLLPSDLLEQLFTCPGIPAFNPLQILHAGQSLTLARALPVQGSVLCTTRVTDVAEKKGRGVFILLETNVRLDGELHPHNHAASSGAQPLQLCCMETSLFLHGITCRSTLAPRSHTSELLCASATSASIMSGPPQFCFTVSTFQDQAILYRLSGDMNPLHIDPAVARLNKFARPILHGLCCLGIVGYLLQRHVCHNIPASLLAVAGRFSSPVFPGDVLTLKVWWAASALDTRLCLFVLSNNDTGKVAISCGKAQVKTAKTLVPSSTVLRSAL